METGSGGLQEILINQENVIIVELEPQILLDIKDPFEALVKKNSGASEAIFIKINMRLQCIF